MIEIQGLHILLNWLPMLLLLIAVYSAYKDNNTLFKIFLVLCIAAILIPFKLSPQTEDKKRAIQEEISTDVYTTEDTFTPIRSKKYDSNQEAEKARNYLK